MHKSEKIDHDVIIATGLIIILKDQGAWPHGFLSLTLSPTIYQITRLNSIIIDIKAAQKIYIEKGVSIWKVSSLKYPNLPVS